jgi:hypothetical protein
MRSIKYHTQSNVRLVNTMYWNHRHNVKTPDYTHFVLNPRLNSYHE